LKAAPISDKIQTPFSAWETALAGAKPRPCLETNGICAMNPYQSVPEKGFWKPAIAARSAFDVTELWDPKFRIRPREQIVTFGSCFAQHFAKALLKRDMNWFDAEPMPDAVSDEVAVRFGYRTFSARTANIYTPSLLLQWLSWAFGETEVPAEVWRKGDRFIDPFRPRIEPDGFESAEAVIRLRNQTLAALRECVTKSGVFVFTLGLTESWFHQDGYEYPMCPGTAGGEFDPQKHRFVNQRFTQVNDALTKAIALMRKHNPKLNILLTVSPVPLIATNSGEHVLVATMQSKSVLRSVAWEASATHDFVDYFPSYEIINAPTFRGMFFEPDQRSVNPSGVDFVMNSFFEARTLKFGADRLERPATRPAPDSDGDSDGDGEDDPARASGKRAKRAKDSDVVCEEEVLAAFGPKS